MADKSVQASSEDNLQEISADDLKNVQEKILANKIPVWRKNRDNQLVTVPLEKLVSILESNDSGDMPFFLEKNWEERVLKKSSKPKVDDSKEKSEQAAQERVQELGNVKKQTEQFAAMSVIEREEVLDHSIESLSDTNSDLNLGAITKMVDVIAKTFYANNANLEDNIKTTNVEQNLMGVLQKTSWIIQIIVEKLSMFEDNYEKLQIIDNIQTKSKTFDHINRTLLWFIAYCIFYNDYIDQGFITKNIRGAFKNKYAKFYEKKFPDTRISLELIFKNGISRIDKEKQLVNYAVGVLLHDMGKIYDIEYHDSSDAEHDEMRIRKHALHSYNLAIKAKQYPFDVVAIAAFHHEYYGGPGSYNFTLPLLTKLTGKKLHDDHTKYFITYNEYDFKSRDAMAYFPCKVLEIIDIFDALVYKQGMSIPDALKFMKKEFIIKYLKIDPVLFRIFLELKLKSGQLQITAFEEIDELQYLH